QAALCLFPNVSRALVNHVEEHLHQNTDFWIELNDSYAKRRHRRPLVRSVHRFLYLTVRLMQPGLVVETGVFDGVSSALILRALEDNCYGRLISIDLL